MHEDREPHVSQVEHDHWIGDKWVDDDQWLDEVLRQTFPASDPIPWCREETTEPTVRRKGQEDQRPT